MKLKITTASILLTIALLFCINSKSIGQFNFEGKVLFEITYTELPEEMKEMESMLPKEVKLYLDGQKSLTEISMGIMGVQKVVLDMEKKTGNMLMDMMGQKIAVRFDEEIKKGEESALNSDNIEYFNEYKKIVGYKCQKAIVTSETPEGESTTSVVYFTKKIPNLTQNYRTLKGMALEYTMNQNGITSIITAVEVSKEDVPDSTFEVPDDYVFKTLEELEKGL